MTQALDVNVNDFRQTDGAATENMGQFELPQNSSALIQVQVFAMRDSDRATRGWTLESLIKRNGGSVVVQETIPSPPNVFGSTADVAALSSVNIGVFSDATNVGVACTGQAGSLISWSVKITGRTLSL